MPGIAAYARLAGTALLLVAASGVALLGWDEASIYYHAGLGLFFLYLGFSRLGATTVRQLVGGLGVLLVVVKGATILLSPWWLKWNWDGALAFQGLGGVLLVGSVAAGTWAVAKMGWARLLFAGALFPPGSGAEENGVPQRLVVEGPYRYVRNPLYDTDVCLIFGAALLTRSWVLVSLAALYLAQLALQLPLEERELGERFGDPYRRYCELVPRFVPRRRPVSQRDLHT